MIVPRIKSRDLSEAIVNIMFPRREPTAGALLAASVFAYLCDFYNISGEDAQTLLTAARGIAHAWRDAVLRDLDGVS